MAYSLLTEPWIPLIRPDGSRRAGSIRDALLQPQQWAGIDSTNPVECLALHRLLLAICHRAIGPANTDGRAALLDTWPSQLIDSYLQQWADRFDLFDPVRPFLQVTFLASVGAKPQPWTRLAEDRVNLTGKMLWDHSIDDVPIPIAPAEGACALIAHQQFVLGKRIGVLQYSASQGPAVDQVHFIPIGSSLQETVALSLVPQLAIDYQLDLPPWERNEPLIESLKDPVAPLVPAGPVQRYTWLSRTVQLLQEEDGSITHVLYGGGERMADSPAMDPMAASIRGQKGPMPLRLRKDQAMWRDFHALTGSGGWDPPFTIQHAALVWDNRGQNIFINLLVGGFCKGSEAAKPGIWRLEQREFSPDLLSRDNAIAAVELALKLAKASGEALNKALWALASEWLSQAKRGSEPDKKDTASLRESLQVMPLYWAALEAEFWSLTHQLSIGTAPSDALSQWQQILRQAIDHAWQHACKQLGDDGRALAAAVRAGPALGRAIAASSRSS